MSSDKNKSKVAKKVSKGNVSGSTSLSNNAIQNANDLSRVNKHNLRDYDNQRELITTIYGTDNIVNDVKQLYLDELQDKMKNACIKSYNKFYEVDTKLKTKKKGRNQDINVNDMSDYRKNQKTTRTKREKT